MSLKEYVATLETLIAATPFVASTSLFYEERPPSAGLLKGTLFFVDGSQLDLKEFLITQPTMRAFKYGYYYHTGSRLIFRYDNANDPAARALFSLPSHKHVTSGLLAAGKPSLEDVLNEIISSLQVS